jgi:hypothetical protein
MLLWCAAAAIVVWLAILALMVRDVWQMGQEGGPVDQVGRARSSTQQLAGGSLLTGRRPWSSSSA